MSWIEALDADDSEALMTKVNHEDLVTFPISSLRPNKLCEGKMVAQLLKIKKGCKGPTSAPTARSLTAINRDTGAGKSRRSTEVYDKLVTARDVGEGTLFYVVSKTSSESLDNFHDKRRSWPGEHFVIIDPRYVFRIGNLRVVRTPHPFIPIGLPPPDLVVKEVPLGEHWANGQFLKPIVYKGVKLHISAPYVKVGCGGTMCDSQHGDSSALEDRCPAINTASVPVRLLEGGFCVEGTELQDVPFRSRRTTLVFMTKDAIEPQNGTVDIFPFKRKVRDILRHYNENNGWNVCGWFKPSYEKEQKWVEPKLHLSYVYPVTFSEGLQRFHIAPAPLQHGPLQPAYNARPLVRAGVLFAGDANEAQRNNVAAVGNVPPLAGNAAVAPGDVPPLADNEPLPADNEFPPAGDDLPPAGNDPPPAGDAPAPAGQLLLAGNVPPLAGDVPPPAGDAPLPAGDDPLPAGHNAALVDAQPHE